MLKIDRQAFLALALGMNLAGCASKASAPAMGDTTQTRPADGVAPTGEGTAVAPHNECVDWSPAGECTKWEPVQECVEWGPADECTKWEPRHE